MKFLLIILLSLSLYANEYRFYEYFEVSHGRFVNAEYGKICKDNLQWIILKEGRRGGLTLDKVWVDKKDLSKGTKPIYCDF